MLGNFSSGPSFDDPLAGDDGPIFDFDDTQEYVSIPLPGELESAEEDEGKPKATPAQIWTRRGIMAALLLALLGGGGWWTWKEGILTRSVGESEPVSGTLPGGLPPARIAASAPETTSLPAPDAPVEGPPGQDQLARLTQPPPPPQPMMDYQPPRYDTLPLIQESLTLAQAPVADLVQETPEGPLPTRADGRVPWEVYGRPVEQQLGLPKVAVLLWDLGLRSNATEAAVQRLPGAVTLAYSAYSHDMADQLTAARSDGHELLLTLPLQPLDFPNEDPGRKALMQFLETETNLGRLHRIMGSGSGYVGFMTRWGGAFTQDPDKLRPILADIRDRGLILVPGPDTAPVVIQTASALKVPMVPIDVAIAANTEPARARALLDRAVDMAAENGRAVVALPPAPAYYHTLMTWLNDRENTDFELMPVTSLVPLTPGQAEG